MAKAGTATKRHFYWRWTGLAFQGRIIWAEAITGLLVLVAIPLGAAWWKTPQDTMNWWPLILFGAVFLGTIAFGFISAPYWLWREERDEATALRTKIAEVEGSYAWSLSLETVGLREQRRTDTTDSTGRLLALSFQLEINLSNSLALPVRYEVRRLSVDGTRTDNYLNRGGVIRANGSTTFYSPALELDVAVADKGRAHNVEVEIAYGSPDVFHRFRTNEFKLIVDPNGQGVRHLNTREDESAIPAAEGDDVSR